MAGNRIFNYLRTGLAMFACCSLLAGAQHRGVVKFGALPVPGATVTATQGDKKFSALTDAQGTYSFADLADGTWTIKVEMLCFAPLEREVAVAPEAPAPVWELKLLPFAEIQASAPPPPPVTTSSAAAAATTKTESAAAPARKSSGVKLPKG